MNYKPGSSGASPSSIYNLMKKEGYQLKNNGYVTYNVHGVLKHLASKSLVLMGGYDTAGRGGHAWVGDAFSYCVDRATNDTIIAQIHCDWGWGGKSNGYYSGDVFAAGGYNFGRVTYFAVAIE